MAVELKGKVILITELEIGTNKNDSSKTWTNQKVVIEETEGEYPAKISIELFNKECTVKVGDAVNAFVNIASREYNGNWYTSAKLWKFEVISSGKHEEVAPANNEPELETDDLPF